uniref:Uncharacterized protein n=1 Tax=Plectus sambesii TaxID=2011161 RepID=A0A914XQN0_9BILA
MGQSTSTSRAAKFSGTHKQSQTVGPNGAALRRTPSNVNRNCKEFSKFWVAGGSFQPKRSVRRRRSSLSSRAPPNFRKNTSSSIDQSVTSPSS